MAMCCYGCIAALGRLGAGETCMQLTPSGWKEREDRKEDYLLTGLKEK